MKKDTDKEAKDALKRDKRKGKGRKVGDFFIIRDAWWKRILELCEKYSEIAVAACIKERVYFRGKHRNRYFFNLSVFAEEIKMGKKTLWMALKHLDKKKIIKYESNKNNRRPLNMVEILDAKTKGNRSQNDHGSGQEEGKGKHGQNDHGLNQNDHGFDGNDHGLNRKPITEIYIRDIDVSDTHDFEDLKGWIEKLHNKKTSIKKLKELCEAGKYESITALGIAIIRCHEDLSSKARQICDNHNEPADFWMREIKLRGHYDNVMREVREQQEQKRRRKEDIILALTARATVILASQDMWRKDKNGRYLTPREPSLPLQKEDVKDVHIEMLLKKFESLNKYARERGASSQQIDEAIEKNKKLLREKFGDEITDKVYKGLYAKN